MAYAPCKNPQCKSFGTAHPNCRCYGGMAKGGEVGYCNGPHQSGCEYFADGGEVVPMDDLPQIDSGIVPADDMPQEADVVPQDDLKDYESPMQQLGTAAEGLAQGVAGPLATFAETKILGIPAEDIKARQEANPWVHGLAETAGVAGSMFIGTGEAALAAKAAAKASEIAKLGKIGSAVINGAITNGIIQGGDEVSKWMLGQGDPADGVGAKLAHVGAAALFGGGFGLAGQATSGAAKMALQEISESQFGQKAEYFLTGVADAMNGNSDKALKTLSGVSKKAYLSGVKMFDSMGAAGALYEGVKGYEQGGSEGALKGAMEGYLGGLAASYGAKKVGPALIKILGSGNLTGAFQALDYAADMAKGSKAIDKGIENIFKGGGIGAQQMLNSYFSDKDRDKLNDYLENGGIDKEVEQGLQQQDMKQPIAFAEGGEVPENPPLMQPNGVETHYPEQNMLLQAARGRISNYLNSLRPTPHAQKLAFDDEPNDEPQKKTYNKAMDIALKPLSVLDEIKHGTLEPEHVKHFNALYPEMSSLMQKRLTEKIINAQLDDEKPSYQVRQGLSMFMGTALSTDLTPMGIQAAQSVFANKQQQQAPQGGSGNKSKLSKSDQAYLTGPQALNKRSQKV